MNRNIEKKVILRGGYGNVWGKQYRQYARVYHEKYVAPAVCAERENGVFVRRWEKKRK